MGLHETPKGDAPEVLSHNDDILGHCETPADTRLIATLSTFWNRDYFVRQACLGWIVCLVIEARYIWEPVTEAAAH